MGIVTQTPDNFADKPELNIGAWIRTNIFATVWHTISAVLLLAITLLTLQAGFNAQPIELTFLLAPNGNVTQMGNLILTFTDGTLLTSIVVIAWLAGLLSILYCVIQNRWFALTHWLKDSLYTGYFSSLITLLLTTIIVFIVRGLLAWGVFGALFSNDPDFAGPLRDVTPGAVWGIVGANLKLFSIGRYPVEEAWRVWVCLGIVVLLMGLSIFAWNLGSPLKKFRQPLVYAWLTSIPLTLFILRGFGETGPLSYVSTNLWGGLLLTMVLSVITIVVSFPIGVLLALGRRSQTRGVPYLWAWGILFIVLYWYVTGFPAESIVFNIPVIFLDPPLITITLSPIQYATLQAAIVVGLFWAVGYYLGGNLIKTISIAYIELIRGVPLITVLFMANVMLPIFLPKGVEVDNVFRVTVGLIMFTAAYLAENVRGGLQSIPKGQYEAAVAVGLNTTQSMRLIILPQALRAVIPAIVGLFIAMFKDTSLVSIVGLFDLLKIAQVVVSQPDWLGLQRETYVFIAFVYWIFAFAMSLASRRLEHKLGVGER